MNKYFLYLSAFLIIFINLNIYSEVAVKISKQEQTKNENRALELIDIIAENTLKRIPITQEQIYELKSLTPYIAGSKKYEPLINVLKQIPAKKEPQTKEEKELYEAYNKPDLTLEDVKKIKYPK